MSYKFIGENIPELKEIPAEERRRSFLKAVGKSYLHSRTWIGLILFFLLNYIGYKNAEPIARILRDVFASRERSEMIVGMGLSILGLLALYYFQIQVVKNEIRKKTNPNQPPERTG